LKNDSVVYTVLIQRIFEWMLFGHISDGLCPLIYFIMVGLLNKHRFYDNIQTWKGGVGTQRAIR
jgi:hypothetical protein